MESRSMTHAHPAAYLVLPVSLSFVFVSLMFLFHAQEKEGSFPHIMPIVALGISMLTFLFGFWLLCHGLLLLRCGGWNMSSCWNY